MYQITNKAELVRKLIQCGETRKPNTLRKYDLATLQAMYAAALDRQADAMMAAMPATLPTIELPPVAEAYIPTDKELYQAALAPKLELVHLRDEPAPAPMNRWVALMLMPFLMLGRIVGM